MKKMYISPCTKNIHINAESALLSMSDPTDPNLGVHNGEEKSDAWTQKQSGNSLWDTWSN